MRGIMLRMVAAFGLVTMLLSGHAFAGNELVMQKVTSDAPIVLASGSHNPCAHSDDHHGKKAGNPCAENPCNPCGHNPCGDATNACNPCGHNPCGEAANPCGHNPCAKH